MKVLGALLVIPGGLLILMIPFAAFDDSGTNAVPGLLLLGGIFGVPGGLLLRSGILRGREEERQTQMAGFVRSHDAFSIDELAAHIGVDRSHAQALLTRDISRYQLPLVMHRASGRYLRLDRVQQSARVAERCQSCGGSLGNQLVFEGEQLTCPYCSSVVQTHAPMQTSWAQAQGGWGQQGWGQPQYAPQPGHYPQQPPGYYQQPGHHQQPGQRTPEKIRNGL